MILRFGKQAVIEELERISREGRRRGAKEQEDDSNLYEMARIIAHAEYMGTKDFPIGRAARIIAERQNYKPGNKRNAKVKTLKRKYKKYSIAYISIKNMSVVEELLSEVLSQLMARTISQEILIERFGQATRILEGTRDFVKRF